MESKLAIGERIALTLWIGGMWAIGYIAVPSLFANLGENKVLAGQLAGQMFTIIYWVSIVCIGLLIVSALSLQGVRAVRQWRSWLLLVSMAVMLVSALVIQPMMKTLKEAGISQGENAASFAQLHGLSSALYMAVSLAGLILLIVGLQPRKRVGA